MYCAKSKSFIYFSFYVKSQLDHANLFSPNEYEKKD